MCSKVLIPPPPTSGVFAAASNVLNLPAVTDLLAEILGDQEGRIGVVAAQPWKGERGVDRQDRAVALLVDGLSPNPFLMNIDGKPFPKPQLRAIESDHGIAFAAVLPSLITVAGDKPLVELGDRNICSDAVGPQGFLGTGRAVEQRRPCGQRIE